MKIDKNLFEKLQGVVNRESFKDTNFALSCIWEYLDVNGDNQIDLKEINDFIISVFSADKNGDGEVDNDELNAFAQKMDDIRMAKSNGARRYITAKDIKKFFKFFIKNTDTLSEENMRTCNEDGTWSIDYVNHRGFSVKETFQDYKLVSVVETKDGVTIIKNGNREITKIIYPDFVMEYSTNEYGQKEETVTCTSDSGVRKYKNVYNQDGSLDATYFYDENGKEINNNIYKSTPYYGNILSGISGCTKSGYQNELDPSRDMDKVIDPVQQGNTGDCFLLNALSVMSKDPAGRKAIRDAISYDNPDGPYTVTFKKAYGKTKSFTFTKEELMKADRFSSGDITVRLIEAAVEKSFKEGGRSLDDGGFESEVFNMFLGNMKVQSFYTDLSGSKTAAGARHNDLDIGTSNFYCGKSKLKQVLLSLKDNFHKYKNAISLDMGDFPHAGRILRFERIDGKDYVVYTHPWDDQGEIREELDSFVNTKLCGIDIFKFPKAENDVEIGTSGTVDLPLENVKKSNKLNMYTAIKFLQQKYPDVLNNAITKDNEGNLIITLGFEHKQFVITQEEIANAKLQGGYIAGDDDATALDIALTRYINETRAPKNTMYQIGHVDMSFISVEDFLCCFSGTRVFKGYGFDKSDTAKIIKYGDECFFVNNIVTLPDNEGYYVSAVSVLDSREICIVFDYKSNRYSDIEMFDVGCA